MVSSGIANDAEKYRSIARTAWTTTGLFSTARAGTAAGDNGKGWPDLGNGDNRNTESKLDFKNEKEPPEGFEPPIC